MTTKNSLVIINDITIRYNKLPKEIRERITLEEFTRQPAGIELRVDTIKNILIGRKTILMYAKQGKRGYYG
jgi:hypothetical protein